jgi:hypothetical protein
MVRSRIKQTAKLLIRVGVNGFEVDSANVPSLDLTKPGPLNTFELNTWGEESLSRRLGFLQPANEWYLLIINDDGA